MVLVGLQGEVEQLPRSEEGLATALHNFAANGVGPVQVLYDREDDGDEVLYVAWPLFEPVRALISCWLVRPDDIRGLRWSNWQGWETKSLERAIAQIIARTKPQPL